MKSSTIHHPERLIDAAALRDTLNGFVAARPFDIVKIRPAIVEVLKAVNCAVGSQQDLTGPFLRSRFVRIRSPFPRCNLQPSGF